MCNCLHLHFDMSASFEISESGDMVKIEALEFSYPDADYDWDSNWIKSKVTVKGGSFHGEYRAEFMTLDFAKLEKEFNALYDNLSGEAEFKDREGYLELKIVGDGIGHFEVDIKACDNPGIYGSYLNFTMNFDQTYIKGFVNHLRRITEEFPIKGKFNI